MNYYFIPEDQIERITKLLLSTPIVHSDCCGGKIKRIYFLKDGELYTRVLDKSAKKSMADTEMKVVDNLDSFCFEKK
jgi:hypothetical protein